MKSGIRPSVILLSLAVVCLLLSLVWRLKLEQRAEMTGATPSSNERADTRPGELEPNLGSTHAEKRPAADASIDRIPKGSRIDEAAVKRANELYRRSLVKAFSWPITFYGKVIDQGGNPVLGADAYFSWMGPPPDEHGQSVTKRTDANGLFELTGAKGRNLGVRIHKPGYYFSLRNNTTGFGYSPEEGNFQASRGNPVIFRLREKGPGVELVTSQYGMSPYFSFKPPQDHAPVWVDFLERRTGSSGHMQLQKLSPQQDRTDMSTKEWRLTLSIPDGGFFELADEEFPFYPPESGYQPLLDFHYLPEQPGWTNGFSRKYYVAFGNPRRYGRIEVNATVAGGVRLEYAINPDGSRYLEPKEKE